MIWSKEVPDLGRVYVEDALLPKEGYRKTRQYLVKLDDAVGTRGICKIDYLGQPIEWYSGASFHPLNEWIHLLNEMKDSLLIEQVMET